MAQVVREKILSQSCGTSQRDHEIKAINYRPKTSSSRAKQKKAAYSFT